IRSSSMNPVIFPMLRNLLSLARTRRLGRRLRDMHLTQRPLVFVREHLHEAAAHRVPVVEDRQRARAAREAQMTLDPGSKQRFVEFARVPQASFAGSDQI